VDENKSYRIGAPEGNSTRNVSGRELLSGWPVPLGPGESKVLHFQRQ
jgi:hypothetical protein